MVIEPKINGYRLAEFGANMVGYTIGACDLDDTYILPSSGIIPVILASRVKLRQITMTLDFEGESAHDVALAISKMTAMFSGEVHLLLPDGFYYWCAYEKASTPTEKAPWIRQVKFTFSGFRHGRKQTFTLAENSTVFIDGNVETPLIVKITPVAGTTEAVFNGVKVTELSGSVTIDGVYTTILDADGMNKFKDTDMTEWPKLKPGFAEIAVEGAATFEVSYYPIWL